MRPENPETVITLSDVPNWVEKYAGFKPNRSTVFRWKTRGCRGKKLKTFRVGGRVCTTVEALLSFFDDEDQGVIPQPTEDIDAILAAEGI